MEMEANLFLSFCNRLEIPSAVICVAIVNRLNGDQITSSSEMLKKFEKYPLLMILQVILSKNIIIFLFFQILDIVFLRILSYSPLSLTGTLNDL